MRKILLAIALIMLVSCVSAIGISAESSLSSGTQWSFTANFGNLESVDEGEIYVDGERALTIFEHSNEVFVANVSPKVMSYNANENTVVVLYVGMNEGEKLVELKTFNEGSVVEETNQYITFFKPMSQSEKETLEDKIGVLTGQVNSMNTTITNLGEEVSLLETQLEEKENEINSLERENSTLKESLEYLRSNITLLEEEGKTNEEIISVVKSDLNVLMTERENALNSPVSGMFSLASKNSTMLLALIALVAIVVGGVFLSKKKGSIYSTPLLGRHEDLPETKIMSEKDIYTPEDALVKESSESSSSRIKGIFSRKKNETAPEKPVEKKRKWAVEPYNPALAKEKSERFALGDLVRKD